MPDLNVTLNAAADGPSLPIEIRAAPGLMEWVTVLLLITAIVAIVIWKGRT
jgi:hypothetical protein